MVTRCGDKRLTLTCKELVMFCQNTCSVWEHSGESRVTAHEASGRNVVRLQLLFFGFVSINNGFVDLFFWWGGGVSENFQILNGKFIWKSSCSLAVVNVLVWVAHSADISCWDVCLPSDEVEQMELCWLRSRPKLQLQLQLQPQNVGNKKVNSSVSFQKSWHDYHVQRVSCGNYFLVTQRRLADTINVCILSCHQSYFQKRTQPGMI